MSAMSDYLETALLNCLFRNTAFSPPANVYLALFTTVPGDDGTGGVEVSGGGYARVTLSTGSSGTGVGSAWDAPAAEGAGGGMFCDNAADITFTTSTTSWGVVRGFGIYDDPTAGNLLIYGALTADKTVDSDVQFVFSAGQLDIAFR